MSTLTSGGHDTSGHCAHESVEVILGLGANIGSPAETIQDVFGEISASVLSEAVLSSLYLTEPQDVKSQPDFINAACSGFFEGSAFDLLASCNKIEATFGRNRSAESRRGPRLIDIDILSFGGRIIDCGEESDGEGHWLRIPHERLNLRRFALVPLLELFPELTDPRTSVPYSDIDAKLHGQGIYSFDTVSYIKSHGGKT